jgi:hypothetical protein
MQYLSKFAAPEHWRDDSRKHGVVFVEFNGVVIGARPSLAFSTLAVPTLEWITKYRDRVLVVLEDHEDGEFTWVGMALNADLETASPDDVDFGDYLTDYPYLRLFFTENWKVTFSDAFDDETNGRNYVKVEHTDTTELKLDRTTDAAKLVYTDGVTGHILELDSTVDAEKIRVVHGVQGHEILMDNSAITLTHGGNGALITIKDGGAAGLEIFIQTAQDLKIDCENATVKANKDILLDAGGLRGGVITTKSYDPFTGTLHIDGALHVNATK